MKYALIVIAGLASFIAFDKWKNASKVCDTKIEKINNEAETQVSEANKAANAVVPSDDLAALCLRDKYCRRK